MVNGMMVGLFYASRDFNAKKVPSSVVRKTIYVQRDGGVDVIAYDTVWFSRSDVKRIEAHDGEMCIDWRGDGFDECYITDLFTDARMFYEAMHIDDRDAENERKQYMLGELFRRQSEEAEVRDTAIKELRALRTDTMYRVASDATAAAYQMRLDAIVENVICRLGSSIVRFYSNKEGKDVMFDCSKRNIVCQNKGTSLSLHVEDDDEDTVRLCEYLGLIN